MHKRIVLKFLLNIFRGEINTTQNKHICLDRFVLDSASCAVCRSQFDGDFYCIVFSLSSFWISIFTITHVRTGVCQATPLE